MFSLSSVGITGTLGVDSCVFLIFTTKVDPTLGSTFFKLILFEKSREELEFVSLIRKHLGNSGRFSEDGDFMENAVSPLLKFTPCARH